MQNAMSHSVKSKTLADFSVSFDTAKFQKHMEELAGRCKDLKRILNSGGMLSEGASLPATSTVIGARDPDRPIFGRQWVRGRFVRGGANIKSRTASNRRGVRHWTHDPVLFKPWWTE
jgi:hypothetical protein